MFSTSYCCILLAPVEAHGLLTHLEGQLLIYCWTNFTCGVRRPEVHGAERSGPQSRADSNLLVLFFQTCSTAATSPHWRISVLSSATSAIRWLLLKASWNTTVRPTAPCCILGDPGHAERARRWRSCQINGRISGRSPQGCLNTASVRRSLRTSSSSSSRG